MKTRIVFAFFILYFCPLTPAIGSTFGAEEFTLDNGLQVVVIPNHRAPVVTHMLWVKAGGADNLPAQSGMAHYFEHLMFKGTKTMAPGDYSKTIKILGGNDNAFTGEDYTAFFESVSVANLPKVMAMEADRFQNLSPPPEHFSSEKSVVLEERRQRTENDPRALFMEQMDAAFFINHPYGTPVIGWMDEIKNYEWSDVKKYYDRWYAPNNMILVVSGDISAQELKPLAQKYYGGLTRKNLPVRIRPNIPGAQAITDLTLHHPQITQAQYYKLYLAPTETKNRADSLALQVLVDILSGGPTSRLYKSLVVEQKKAITASLSYNANALDYGTLSLEGTPAQGITPQELSQLFEEEIKKVIAQGVSDAEVKESIQKLEDEAIFARDSLAGPAMIFGQAMATGSSVADIENWPQDIAKITSQDVVRVAKTYLDENNPWVRAPINGYLLPAEKPQMQEDINHVRKE